MGKINRKNKKKGAPKNRQELRKEKRLKKKENKHEFFSKKKKDVKKNSTNKNEIANKPDKNKFIDADNEIESDFDLSDEELNSKLTSVTKNSNLSKENKNKSKKQKISNEKINNVPNDRFLENQQREKKKQKELERKMKKQRIEQLTDANEDEDKVIRKLEKKLGINKHENNKSVHKMFSDGLDFALELCLPDNIGKMYSAAKEAAKIQENESEDEFEDDLLAALGENEKSDLKNISEAKYEKKTENQKLKLKKDKATTKKNNIILKQVESKYFKESDSDLSDVDSELSNSEYDSEDDNKEQEDSGNELDESEIENIDDEEEETDNEDEEIDDETEKNSEIESDEISNQNYENENALDNNIEIINSEVSQEENENLETMEEKSWEDIYGRKRDAEGNILKNKSGKYVPPHIRARLEVEEIKDPKRKEKLVKLKRQLKGLLNRLAEANMIKISKEIENLYRNNSRFDMNNAFNELLMDALVTNTLSKERMVLEYTMLIAILHVNVGNEISAHILQELALRMVNLIDNIESLEVENKELDNITFVISHMYSYKIFQHSLIFEIINRLIQKLCEKSVECILLIFKSIGFQLRKDDPLALRDIILSIQKRSSEIGPDIQNNSRFKFMIEILTAIKNNNMHKIPQYDPTLAEHLKKILKNIFTNGKYLSTLNITMDDLLNADKKGKWWVVGSAWTGSIKDIGPASQNIDGEKYEIKNENFTEQLLELAKKQRMNTDDRRNIFCIIMSSEDYLDAFEKLLRLSIKDVRLIVSIIIHCCLSEKYFNPYYGVLAEKFCAYDRKYFLAVQFSVWDRIKDIDSLNKQQIENLAKFVLYLVRKGSQPISILKIVEFTELNKATLRFVRIIILAILLGDKSEMIQIFKRISPSVTLNQFKNAIMLFIRHFLLKGSEKSHVPKDKIELLSERINEVEGIIFNRSFI